MCVSVSVPVAPILASSSMSPITTDAGPRELMANTRFFRYPGLFDVLVDLLAAMPDKAELRVLIVPLSVGLEAVSFVIAGLRKGLLDRRKLIVEGFDLSAKATELAQAAVYPRLFFPEDLEFTARFRRRPERRLMCWYAKTSRAISRCCRPTTRCSRKISRLRSGHLPEPADACRRKATG